MKRTHPEHVPGDHAWARLSGTAGDRFHALRPGSPLDLVAYCGARLESNQLRSAPLVENLPGAVACPACLKAMAEGGAS